MTDLMVEQLKDLLVEKLDRNISRESIDPDAPILEDGLKLDSLALVELISLVEDHFGVEFGEEDLNMESFANLRTLAAAIAAQKGGAITTSSGV